MGSPNYVSYNGDHPMGIYRRVSVIRGQVLSPDGLGIVGIRVSVDKSSRFGFTLTRKGGWYDNLKTI